MLSSFWGRWHRRGQSHEGHEPVRSEAINVLLAADANARDRLALFASEVYALAPPSHPHIAELCGVEDMLDVCSRAMELVEGALAGRIAHGAIPLKDVPLIEKQVSKAPETVHDRGRIPCAMEEFANITVRPRSCLSSGGKV